MVRRGVHDALAAALDRVPAVALLGPRQVGKTTLALAVAEARPSLYLDLQSESDRAKVAEPELFLASQADRLVILDEVHRAPNLFPLLRGMIDRGRREGKRTGRFLLLGSASVDLLHQAGESLAGRIAFVDLPPFQPAEVATTGERRERLFLRGGFPDSFLAEDEAGSFRWRTDFVRTYLERDVTEFVPRVSSPTLRRLWTMLAHRQGAPLNAAELARSIDGSHASVARYLDLLDHLLLVRRLTPWIANVGKRLTKSPKVYIRDSGLVHALLGIRSLEELEGHPVVGSSWEGFVVESILNALERTVQTGYYRTAAGAEVDLVLEFGSGARWAIEVKRSVAPKPTRGFWSALRDLDVEQAFVVHAGEDRYPLGEGAEAIGLLEMVGLVRGRG